MIDANKLLEISQDGEIQTTKSLTPYLTNHGYMMVSIYGKGVFVHRLLAEKYIPNPENKPFVNHKNGIKTDNRIENLEWVTSSENNKHAYLTGLKRPSRGNQKAVIGKNLITQEIKEWQGTREAAREIVSGKDKIICGLNRDFTKKPISKVEDWGLVYKDDFYPGIFETYKIAEKFNKKPVQQIDLKTGEVIKEFESARTAATELGIGFTMICSVCKGNRKSTGGFSWKYK